MSNTSLSMQIKNNIQLLIESNKLKEAKELIQNYNNMICNDIDVFSMEAVILILEGNLKNAEKILLAAFTIDDENFDINYNLGYVNEKLGKINESTYYYKRAYNVCDNNKVKEEINEHLINNKINANEFDIKKILFIQSIPDIRTNKIAQVLYNKGIQTDILYVQIHPEDVYKGLKLPYKNVYRLLEINETIKFINESDYDVLFSCNEPDYLSALLTITNKPIIHDCHDMMSLRGDVDNEQIIIEYLANHRCDGNIYITSLVENIAKQKFSLNDKPRMVLDNYVLKEQLPKRFLKKLSEEDGEIHCVYEGGLTATEGHHRNIQDIFLNLAKDNIHVHYYTSFENNYYIELASKSDYIHFEGTKPPNELIEEMTKYDVGLALLNITEVNKSFLDSTFPNKAWEYLAAGLPILFSDLTSFRLFLKKYHVGEVINLEMGLKSQIERVNNISIDKSFLKKNKLCMDDFANEIISFLNTVKKLREQNESRDTNAKLSIYKENHIKKESDKIIISGSYGSGNLGDEFISYSIKNSMIGHKIDKAMCFNEDICAYYLNGLEYYKQNDFQSCILGIKNSNGLLFGGGGLFYDYGDINQSAIRYRLLLASYAMSIGKPIYILNVGTNGILLDMNRDLVRNVFNYADYISVRDAQSFDELREIGVRNKITISSDSVFSLLPTIKTISNKFSKKKRIGVQIRPIMELVYKNHKKDDEVYNKIAKIADYFIEKYEYDVSFFSTYIPYDSTAYDKIYYYSKNKDSLRKVETYDFNTLLGNMSQCECFIGMSLHFLIFASMLNAKLIGIGYHPKIKSFCEELCYGKYYIDYPDFCVDKAIQLIEELINDKVNYSDKVQYLYNQCMEAYREISEKIKQPYMYKHFRIENKNMENFLFQNQIEL